MRSDWSRTCFSDSEAACRGLERATNGGRGPVPKVFTFPFGAIALSGGMRTHMRTESLAVILVFQPYGGHPVTIAAQKGAGKSKCCKDLDECYPGFAAEKIDTLARSAGSLSRYAGNQTPSSTVGTFACGALTPVRGLGAEVHDTHPWR